jgi:hypothetical protein
MRHHPREVLRPAFGLAAGWLVAAAAAAAGPALDLRTVSVPEAGLTLTLWDEQAADGSLTSHYAVTNADGALRGRPRATGYAVELADFHFDPLVDGEPPLADGLVARPGNRLFLVQLVATPLPELQRLIVEAGGTIHRHYTQHTLLVEMDPLARSVVESLAFVRWVGPYHPAYRVEGALRAALAGETEELPAERYSVMTTRRGKAAQLALVERIRQLGGELHLLTPEGFRLEATLGHGQLAALVHDDGVHYVDRWGGPGGLDMDIVREVGGANYVEQVGGFTGQGVAGEIFDTELRFTHQEWALTPILHSVAASCDIPHGTSVTSNVFAQGVNPMARGGSPSGQPIFFCYAESSQFGGPTSRYDINEELLDPAGPYRAVFQTASVGSSQTTEYTTISAETDDYLFLHQLLSTQSQSNLGNQSSRPQAWAKNIVAVGGIKHFNTADRGDDEWDFGASIGPAADGRVKPDLAFFYDVIFSATNSSDTSYGSFGGTSSATPQTAGYFGLLFEMWHEGVWPDHGGGASVFDSRPHMVTAKALMIHGAHRYDWTQGGPNGDIDRFKQGWGTADARSLYDAALETQIVDESVVLAPLASYQTTVELPAGKALFNATLAYVDPMGTPGAEVHRINDLSLKVTSPSADVYWGNNGLDDDNLSESGGSSNTIDTVENVFVANPAAGTWTIEVLADEVVEDAHLETPEIDVDFALVLSPDGSLVFADGFESGDTSAWTVVTP